MQARTYALRDAERIMPLLRSIRREIRERTIRATQLEERLQALSRNRRAHQQEIHRAEAELSTQLRELRRVERELAELGCKQDADQPLRILIPSGDGALVCDGDLSQTRIRPLQYGSRP